MKKLTITVVISIIFVIILISLAFLYIDLTGHKSFYYDVFVGGQFYGTVEVDRYVTEDRVIYKTKSEYPHSLECPVITGKLVLKKGNMLPLKYTKESTGVRGATKIIQLEQKVDKTDFLFRGSPGYFTMKDFETGHKTMVFSPYDVMLYMPVMEKYNFWRKGAQFVEVVIPLEEPVPVFRDKLEVKYMAEEYIPIMGRKVEAGLYSVKAKGLPEARVYLSKYTHNILSLEIPLRKMRFVLTDIGGTRSIIPQKKNPARSVNVVQAEGQRQKEVFFESEGRIISAYLWEPGGNGPFPSVILVNNDGPMTTAERILFESYAKSLSGSGFAVLTFDKPEQGKSQGDLADLDDARRVRNIVDACIYLKSLPKIRKDRVVLIGYKAGGYLCLKASQEIPDLLGCVVIAMPLESFKEVALDDSAVKEIKAALIRNKIGPFDDVYMATITGILREHMEKVLNSKEEASFFMGVKVPRKGYRDYIVRAPYKAVLSSNKPLLMIIGRKDEEFDPQITENLRKSLAEIKKENVKMATIMNLDGYMGMGIEPGCTWNYKINSDAFKLILN
ncbi:MAG: alpha/beta fold hydrolase, partial [Candidatus Omnitrophota bacterium]